MTELNKGMFVKASKIFQRSEQERLREEEVIRYELRLLNLTRRPPRVSLAVSFIGVVHIGTRALHVLNLIWFG
jgi:hypothetical protein